MHEDTVVLIWSFLQALFWITDIAVWHTFDWLQTWKILFIAAVLTDYAHSRIRDQTFSEAIEVRQLCHLESESSRISAHEQGLLLSVSPRPTGQMRKKLFHDTILWV